VYTVAEDAKKDKKGKNGPKNWSKIDQSEQKWTQNGPKREKGAP
jgi:hypothetical protein